MRQSTVFLALLASAACAQELEFFFPGGYEGVDPVATVTEANPSTTAFRLACPTDADSTECGWGSGAELSIVSTTIYHASMSEGSFDMSMECEHNTRATEMSCSVGMTQAQSMGGGVEQTQTVLKGSDVVFLTASVVEGASLLSEGASAGASDTPQSTGAAATAAGSGPAATSEPTGGAASAGSQSVSPGSSATSSGDLAEFTGAAARFGLESSVLLALAGAAALQAW